MCCEGLLSIAGEDAACAAALDAGLRRYMHVHPCGDCEWLEWVLGIHLSASMTLLSLLPVFDAVTLRE